MPSTQTLVNPRRQKDDLLLSAPQAAYETAQEFSPRSMTPSAADATTFTEPNVDATLPGKIVEWEDGNCRGMRRLVLSISSTTATIDKAWPAAPTGTRLRVWVPAAPLVRCTAQGAVGKTTSICSDFTGIVNFVAGTFITGNGYGIAWIAGSNAGSFALITSFDPATGTFTHAAVGTRTDVGDLGVIVKVHRPEGDQVDATVDHEHEERPLEGSDDPEQGVMHNRPGTIGFALAHRPIVTAGGNGAVASRPIEVGDLLTDVMTESLGTGTTVVSVAAGPPLVITATDGAGFAAGQLCLNSAGEVGLITAKSTNDLTIAPGHMTAAKMAASSVLYGGANYYRKVGPSGDWRPRTFYYFRWGTHLEQYADGMAKLSLAYERSKVLRLAFSYPTSMVERNHDLTRWIAKGASMPLYTDAQVPGSAMGPRCLIDDVRVRIADFKLDFGLKPTRRDGASGLNESDGTWMDTEPQSGSIGFWADNDDRTSFVGLADRIASGIPFMILLQRASAAKRTFAACVVAAQVKKGTAQHNANAGYFACDYVALKPQATEGNSYGATIQPVVMAYL